MTLILQLLLLLQCSATTTTYNLCLFFFVVMSCYIVVLCFVICWSMFSFLNVWNKFISISRTHTAPCGICLTFLIQSNLPLSCICVRVDQSRCALLCHWPIGCELVCLRQRATRSFQDGAGEYYGLVRTLQMSFLWTSPPVSRGYEYMTADYFMSSSETLNLK